MIHEFWFVSYYIRYDKLSSDRSKKSKDENKRNLENVEPLIDGGISSKEETDAVDLSMDCTCVEGKSENKQLM